MFIYVYEAMWVSLNQNLIYLVLIIFLLEERGKPFCFAIRQDISLSVRHIDQEKNIPESKA